ncbi:hypothetical protein CUPS9163_08640 [Campylobacter upsaliensis]|uniref:Uncharacterized protein n=1 Tax=Campylobacter upsaliensis TaxID=28080 RepID=A0A7U8B386_CAMUP|nr:hypothetical protein [Campylobacter upsaliensis]EAH9136026.1 hypothetical protein [Campylobacter upsaliensis]EAH9147390.1 hypothetical protein [Campylobacter upsaliensis]EAI8514934.1 hypothetical protein [Campylobacter upsaliensis]EAJ1621992.1 hypothetical protein [Campylobacter upsaliensis]EFQ4877874.1 hypothetical protein [Campylobacter upsaliensis]
MNFKNIKLTNKGLFLALVYATLLSVGANADEFNDALNTVTSASNTGRGVLGEGMRWVFAVFLPAIFIFTGMFLGYTQAKKKAEQEQASFKIYVITGISALIGFFVYCIAAMLFSSALFGDSKAIFERIYEFWRTL